MGAKQADHEAFDHRSRNNNTTALTAATLLKPPPDEINAPVAGDATICVPLTAH
jgi:hypothetical protein